MKKQTTSRRTQTMKKGDITPLKKAPREVQQRSVSVKGNGPPKGIIPGPGSGMI